MDARKQANELELMLWQHQNVFWERIFTVDVGYLSIVIPVVLNKECAGDQLVLTCVSILLGLLSVLFFIPAMNLMTRKLTRLVGIAKKCGRGEITSIEDNPVNYTCTEFTCITLAVVSWIASVACLILSTIVRGTNV